ncbi:two-component sensor histidine kinase [Patiriisocius marinistellae]|uniref:Oxygen sensor histidine kinase NreB n=1 Tax=Patiriisocius marinistellae TaxID=2494560 RepID=A0A5J4FZW5_9FLAO|nr:sensor histidine kinase [Patiriisocius marinistellae]GEQ85756.1 two-component sensor histidine kinase [Patiriisocius marinistellae]
MNLLKKNILIILISCPLIVLGQLSHEIENISKHIYLLDFNKSQKLIDQLEDKDLRITLEELNNIIKNRGSNKKIDSIALDKITHKNKPHPYTPLFTEIVQGYYNMYYGNDQSKSLNSFNNALKIASANNNKAFQKLIISNILQLYSLQKTPNSIRQLKYLEILESISETCQDATIVIYFETLFFGQSTREEALKFIPTAKKLNKILNTCNFSKNWESNVYDLLMVYFRETNKQDSLIKYANKLLALPTTNYTKLSKFYAHLELASLNATNNNAKEATKYLSLSKSQFNELDSTRAAYSYYRFGAMKVLSVIGEYEQAYNFLEKSIIFEHHLNFKENQQDINQLQVELETAEKEKQLLLSEQENKKQEYFLIALGGLLVLGSFIAVLINLNTKRKQRIAEQEKEIEIQKIERLLKEQELTTIDAMIEGQEKERQRLAGDLHDNVGATLAAAKLQFEHLKRNRAKSNITDELYEKTSFLLADAYSKIRNISHINNSGVIAKNGLLPAVQKLARNASINGKLNIEVSDFGLENRIENTLEIMLFRVIQELVTNIIKHSKASEASIAITQHEGIINIIIEDNGIGISEERKLINSTGMGLENIEKRIEHIDGTFEIDSSLGKGTTIIIDIPVEQNTQ